jgi:hypothetical protein
VQQATPEAMAAADDGVEIAALAESPDFLPADHRDFRMWVEVTHDGLLERIPEQVRDEAAELLLGVSRQAGPLRLPYSVHCWRADAVRTRSQLKEPEDSLRISL